LPRGFPHRAGHPAGPDADRTVDLVSSGTYSQAMDYRASITIEPGKRGGKPCIRGLRITVYDVLAFEQDATASFLALA